MHVGLVTGIFPPDIGGPATFIPALGTGLAERGHAVEVVTYSDAPHPPGEWPFRVTRIRRASGLRRAHAVVAILRMAWRADVLLVNGLLEAATLANRVARRLCAVKLVGDFAWERARNMGLTTQAFVAFQQGEHGVPITRWQRERNRSLRHAAALIVPSEFLRDVVEGWGTGRPVHVIPNGIADDFVRAADAADLDAVRARHRLPQRFLLYAGRLTNWKGCDTLIRVLPKLPEDVALVIVGDGPERAALAAIAQRLRLSECVQFVPPIDRTAMAPLLRLAACLVLNSGYEGHPHVVLEAMAVGTPVVGAAECGTADLVHDGENGLLFEKDNAPQLVAAITQILDDDAVRERLVAGGRATVQRFPWSATLDRTEALLQQLARRRP